MKCQFCESEATHKLVAKEEIVQDFSPNVKVCNECGRIAVGIAYEMLPLKPNTLEFWTLVDGSGELIVSEFGENGNGYLCKTKSLAKDIAWSLRHHEGINCKPVKVELRIKK